MSPITTHVLDTALGLPAVGVPVVLAQRGEDGAFLERGRGTTDADGRIGDLLSDGELSGGVWRLTFDTGTYFRSRGAVAFYPEVTVTFRINEPGQHYHVPLLLSPFGYSTYRGS